MDMNAALYARRRRANAVGLTLSMGAMALGLTVLLWILYILFSNGLAAIDGNLFTQDTPAPGTEGGTEPGPGRVTLGLARPAAIRLVDAEASGRRITLIPVRAG